VILPIGDSPNPPGTPRVTYALIAINVLVFLLTLPLEWQAPDPRDPEAALEQGPAPDEEAEARRLLQRIEERLRPTPGELS
jgi:hypothetical protein